MSVKLADPLCVRCRIMLVEDDPRTWAISDEQLVCPNCLSPYDLARGAELSEWRTLAARLAAAHPAAIEMTIGVLESRIRDGDRFVVRAWLHRLAHDGVHGVDALVELAVSAITLLDD